MSKTARIALLVTAVAMASPLAAQPLAPVVCLSPVEARQAAQTGQVVPLSELRARIAAAAGGEVVSAQLCRTGVRLVYYVNLLTRQGVVRKVTIDAQSGIVVN